MKNEKVFYLSIKLQGTNCSVFDGYIRNVRFVSQQLVYWFTKFAYYLFIVNDECTHSLVIYYCPRCLEINLSVFNSIIHDDNYLFLIGSRNPSYIIKKIYLQFIVLFKHWRTKHPICLCENFGGCRRYVTKRRTFVYFIDTIQPRNQFYTSLSEIS